MKKILPSSSPLDRDRLLHSRSFRQLDRKSEIFLDTTGEVCPSRLFYALQSASISRLLAERLRLDEAMTEAMALAGALGGPAFGWAGIETLRKLLSAHGGFDPATHSLRLALELEMRNPEFNGLDLSEPLRGALQGQSHAAEAETAVWGKRLAVLYLDLEAGLDSGLIEEEVLRGCALWQEIAAPAEQRYPRLDISRRRAFHQQNLLSRLIEIVTAAGEGTPPGPRDEETKAAFTELEKTVEVHVRRAPSLREVYQDRGSCLETLFAIYTHRPHLLQESHGLRVKKEGVHRAVGDFLAHAGDRELVRLRREIAGEEEQPKRRQKAATQDLLL